MQRARDGRGGQREHVDARLERLEALFVGDAEALLLVHDHQPQILKGNILRQQPVRCR